MGAVLTDEVHSMGAVLTDEGTVLWLFRLMRAQYCGHFD